MYPAYMLCLPFAWLHPSLYLLFPLLIFLSLLSDLVCYILVHLPFKRRDEAFQILLRRRHAELVVVVWKGKVVSRCKELGVDASASWF